jgi:tellurite methyltransferase
MDQEETHQESENTWEGYYEWLKGRKPRRLFVEALARFGTSSNEAGQLHAIDLGCGDGTETLVLLRAGWSVLAIDRDPAAIEQLQSRVPARFRPRLEALTGSFEELHLPPASFVYAGYSLPFCRPEYFDRLWVNIVASIRPDGRFAGQLFGIRDSWANKPDMTFHSAEHVASLLEAGFEIEVLDESEQDGEAFNGPKHWHIFEIIARRLR